MPVLPPVAVGAHGSELQHRFGSVEGPSSTGDVEPVADEVPARPFDHSGGDRVAGRERFRIVEVGPLVLQVPRALVGLLALRPVETEGRGLAGDRAGGEAGFAFEHGEGLVGDPGLGGRVALVEEAPGSTPQVLEDVDEVTDDRDLDADRVDLVLRAVDECDPWT